MEIKIKTLVCKIIVCCKTAVAYLLFTTRVLLIASVSLFSSSCNAAPPTPGELKQLAPEKYNHKLYRSRLLKQIAPPGWSAQFCCKHFISIVTAPGFGVDRRAIRFELDKGEGRRAELHNGKTPTRYEQDYWYAFDTYVPAEWGIDENTEIIAQWHSRLDRHLGEQRIGGPPLSIRINGDHWDIRTIWDSSLITNRVQGDQILWSAPLERARWVKWVVRARWSYTERGMLKIWKDDTLIVDRKGPNSTRDIAGGPYFKFGIYKPAWKRQNSRSRVNQRIIYFNNIRIGEGDMEYEDFNSLAGDPGMLIQQF